MSARRRRDAALIAFDNSSAETVVTQIDRPPHRKLEPILEKQLTATVDAGGRLAGGQ